MQKFTKVIHERADCLYRRLGKIVMFSILASAPVENFKKKKTFNSTVFGLVWFGLEIRIFADDRIRVHKQEASHFCLIVTFLLDYAGFWNMTLYHVCLVA